MPDARSGWAVDRKASDRQTAYSALGPWRTALRTAGQTRMVPPSVIPAPAMLEGCASRLRPIAVHHPVSISRREVIMTRPTTRDVTEPFRQRVSEAMR